MKLPAIRKLPSGNYFCQLRLDGRSISITDPDYNKVKAQALAYKTGVLKAKAEPLSITLGAACDAYIAAREGVCSPTTVQGYRAIRDHGFQSIMPMRLSALTPRVLAAAVQREAQRRGRSGRKVSAKYMKNAWGFLSSVLRESGVDPGRVQLPEVKRKIVRLPDPPAVIRAVVGTDIELPCLLAAWLSLSMSEIRGLTKSKSILNGQLYVAETLVRVKSPAGPSQKQKKDGTPSKIKSSLQDVRKEGGKEELRSRVLDIPPYIAALIDQVEGDVIVPLTPRQISGRFTRLIEKAGLPHMTFHQLRHLNASAMAMLGVQKEIAQERGGWKTPHTMDRVYTHVFDAPRRAADEKIDAYFSAIVSPGPSPPKSENANETLTKSRKRKVYKLFKG